MIALTWNWSPTVGPPVRSDRLASCPAGLRITKGKDCAPVCPKVSRSWPRLTNLQSGLLLRLNIEEFVELGNFENFVYLRIDIAEHEPAVYLLKFLIEGDQFGQGGAGKILHVAEIQQNFTPPRIFDQTEKLLANDLNVLL